MNLSWEFGSESFLLSKAKNKAHQFLEGGKTFPSAYFSKKIPEWGPYIGSIEWNSEFHEAVFLHYPK